ncbi:MAG: aromatic ring-hydroxylating dioxygenase subunit alpha [Gammaproteobacteria bacterium]|nr:aromatic ring-hydroxylating dioxygenase subunit alpha [Gammaproteobacteria bacterium]
MKTISNIPYISDAFYEHEKRIWRTAWLVAGRASDLDEAGKFITLDLSAINVSVFVVRDSAGKLNAFHNICSHRNGRLVCDYQGKKAAITRRYHGWTFQLDGKLRGIPEQHLFPDINKNDYSLMPVSVDTWGGFVFVNLNSTPECTLDPNLLLFIGADVLTIMISWRRNAHEAEWEIDWFHKDKLRNFGNLFIREQGRLATRNALTEDWPVVEWAHENMRTGLIDKSTIGSEMEATVWAHYIKLLQHLNLSEDGLQNEYA